MTQDQLHIVAALAHPPKRDTSKRKVRWVPQQVWWIKLCLVKELFIHLPM